MDINRYYAWASGLSLQELHEVARRYKMPIAQEGVSPFAVALYLSKMDPFDQPQVYPEVAGMIPAGPSNGNPNWRPHNRFQEKQEERLARWGTEDVVDFKMTSPSQNIISDGYRSAPNFLDQLDPYARARNQRANASPKRAVPYQGRPGLTYNPDAGSMMEARQRPSRMGGR